MWRSSGWESAEQAAGGRSARLRAVFVGAHPDDIEIGAGGTLARLVDHGVDVRAVVVSDETDRATATTRRAEAVDGLAALGLAAERIAFLGLPDRTVTADEQAIGALRPLLGGTEETMLIITHTPHDRHSDHRAVHEMVMAATPPGCPIVGMRVVNSVTAAFRPDLAVDTAGYAALKASALDRYPSQDRLGRIRRADIVAVETACGAGVGIERAEAFEVFGGRRVLELQWSALGPHWIADRQLVM